MPSGKTVFAPILTPTTWTDQAPGVAGSPLTASDLERNVGAAVAYHRRAAFFQGSAAAQNIATSTWTPINLTELIDIHGGHSDDANPARVAGDVSEGGDDWYLCVGMVPVDASANGAVTAGLRLNGGTIYEGAKLPLGTGHAATAMVADLLRMQTGSSQYVELMTYQNSGAALATQSGGGKAPQLAIRWACSNTGDVVSAPPTPRTWTADDMLTASLAGPGQVPLNTHVRDVVRWLRYPPAVRLDSRGTTQTIPSGAWTSVAFPWESFDNYNGHDNATNNTRYTVQRPGLYFVYGCASLSETGTTGYRASRLLVNGTTAYAGTSVRPVSGSTTGSSLPAVAHLRLAAGDYVELQSFQSQGSALAVKSGTGDSSTFVAVWRGL